MGGCRKQWLFTANVVSGWVEGFSPPYMAVLTWTADNLRKWISNNEGRVPGARMRHVSITDPAEQDYLISFLATLK
jgi:cytochrome c2